MLENNHTASHAKVASLWLPCGHAPTASDRALPGGSAAPRGTLPRAPQAFPQMQAWRICHRADIAMAVSACRRSGSALCDLRPVCCATRRLARRLTAPCRGLHATTHKYLRSLGLLPSTSLCTTPPWCVHCLSVCCSCPTAVRWRAAGARCADRAYRGRRARMFSA
jgi:hypothetical protein